MPMPCRRGTQNRKTVGLVIYSRTDHTKPQRFSSAVFTQEKYMHKATKNHMHGQGCSTRNSSKWTPLRGLPMGGATSCCLSVGSEPA